MGILDKIFGEKKPRTETYVTLPPYEMPELLRMIDRKLKQENAILKAENFKLRERLEKIEEKLEDQVPEELEELKLKAYKKKEQIKKEKDVRRVRFKIVGKQPTFLSTGRKVFGKYNKCYGIELYELDNGEFVVTPLLTNGKDIGRLGESVLNFRDLFKDKDNIPSQLRSGVLRSSFDVTEDGKLIVLRYPKNSGKKNTDKEISDVTEYQYVKKIGEMEDENAVLRSKVHAAEKRNLKMKHEIDSLKTSLDIQQISSEYGIAIGTSGIQTMKSVMTEHGKSLLANQHAEVNRIIADKLTGTYKEALDNTREILEEQLPKDMRDVVREQLKLDIKDIVSTFGQEFMKAVQKQTPTEVKPPTPPEARE